MKLVTMRVHCVLFFICIAGFAQAQDITGIWRGHFRSNDIYQRLMSDDDRYRMEVQIAQHNKTLEAVTYSYRSTIFYGKAAADGSVDFKTKKVLLRELKIVELRMVGGDACIMTCYLNYSKLGDEEFLEGTYTSRNTRDSSDCGKGSIFLHKVVETDFYKEPFLEKKEKESRTEKKKIATPPPAPDKKPAVDSPVAKTIAKHTTTTSKKTNTTGKNSITAKKTTPPATKTTNTTTNATSKKTVSAPNKTAVAQTKSNKPQVKTTVLPKTAVKADINKQSIETVGKDSIAKIEKKSMPVIIPKVLSSRSNEVVKTLTVNSPDIVLNIYDDGVIDNDTVSVYYDKKLIVSNARLTDQPIVVKLHLEDSNEPHELVMVAENEGDIPPNTSLMIVKAGEKQYEVRIVSTEQKNAVVMFKYEKPE